MSIFNPAQCQYFINLLTGGDSSLLTWQVYYDPKDGTERKDLAKWYNAEFNNIQDTLKLAESNLCGVYLCINEMDGFGRNAVNTKRVRALFADFDGVEEPNWPLTPHFVTKRDDTHGHAFWLVDGVDVDQFMYLQRRIALVCNTDTQVVDPSRVVRLPGTGHFKDPANPAVYNVAWDNTANVTRKYTVDDIYTAFDLTGDNLTEYEKYVSSRESFDEGTGFKDEDVYLKKFTSFLTNSAQPAVDGDGATMQVIRVASMAYDYGITLDTCQELMWEHYNPRCEPPWCSDEQDHFELTVTRAYKYAKNAPGCRTAGASFDPIPPPPPPRPVKEIVRDGDRLTESEAGIMSPMMNGKSSHYELAQVYDGILYDGVKILRCNEIFYQYDGRAWSSVDDAIIKANIQRFYSKFKPGDTLVRGIFNSFKDLTTVNYTSLEDGTWLDSGIEAKNMLCFKNGLVDLSNDNPTIIDHTPNYFTFNKLEYDYTVDSQCPEFLEFLHSIWPDDPDLVLQLQEWMGYCLVTDVSFQKMALLTGKSRTGKGVLADIISEMVGRDNTVAPSLSNLMANSTLHKMSTARLALIPDAHNVHASKRDDVLSGIKAITGCDPLTFDVKYKAAQTVRFKVKLMLSTNNMPEFIDASGALVNRLLVFPFRISFKDREDVGLKSRLLKEVDGIAQWALQGLKRLRITGKFTEAAAGVAEKEHLKEEMNPLGRFIEDACKLDMAEFVISERIYDTYLLWCKQHKIHSPMSQSKLTRILKAADLPILQERRRIDGKRKVGFRGLNVVVFDPIEDATNQ